MVFAALCDMMEMQKGKERVNNYSRGELHFDIWLFGVYWKLRFKVEWLDEGRCCVKLSIRESGKYDDDEKDELKETLERMITSEFSLLDNMLLIVSPLATTFAGVEN